jgi:hypothetical protein
MVKLNIEMTMANLIKRIAISTSRKTGMASIAQEFKSSSNMSTTGQKTGQSARKSNHNSVHELTSFVSYSGAEDAKASERVISFAPMENQIKKTHEVIVRSEPNPFFDRRPSETEITGGYRGGKPQGVALEERRKSMESITEGNESLRSSEMPKRGTEDSDDEAALVAKKAWGWSRRPS